MDKDILFLLPPGFFDNDRREYCPECAELWGVLSYFPAIMPSLDIRYMEIGRPRMPMVELLGEANQNCPTLVLARPELAEGLAVQRHGDLHFLDNARAIGHYFARKYGTPVPRGS